MCNKFVFSVSCLLLHIYILKAIQINTVTVPSAVQNNTGKNVILDCEYVLRPGDDGLVLKWFLNGKTCVYQWIPPKKPQGLGPLKDRLDLSYIANDDPLMAYRAMKIINPTTEIAGEYKCFVSTYSDEDEEAKDMIVFEPEERLSMVQGKPIDGQINFTCNVFGVYPPPELIIYKNNAFPSTPSTRNNIDVVTWTQDKHLNGRYDTSIIASSSIANLTPGDILDCEMRIPNTGYVKKKSLVYYPPFESRSSSTILSLLHIIVVVAIWIILFI